MNNNLLEQIRKRSEKFGKTNKAIADFVLADAAGVADMSFGDFKEKLKVSGTDIVKFVNKFDFKDYEDFRKGLKGEQEDKKEPVSEPAIEVKSAPAADSLASKICKFEVERIEQMFNSLNEDQVDVVVDLIDKSKKIYLLGIRETLAVTGFLAEGFKCVGKEVVLITGDIMNSLYRITSDDLLFVVCFPDYSYSILKAMEYANMKQVNIVSVTDDSSSPASIYSSCILTTPTKRFGVLYSITTAMALCNMLLTKLMSIRLDEFEEDFARRMEAGEYSYSGSDYINPIDIEINE